jgi:membrane protease YdiL (CAAX protease family)
MEPLREMIRRLSTGVEFLIVVSWAFGQFIFGSIMSIGAPAESAYTNQALLSVLITELLQFAFLIWFLRVRGWTLEKIGVRIGWRTSAGGILLAVGTLAMFFFVQILASAGLDMSVVERLYPKVAPNLDLNIVFVTSLVNGTYEELFVAGYIITVLASVRGVWTAVNVSTGIRLLYHLYQGTLGVLTIVPMGLLYGYIFVRTRQLWPLIVAHVVIDLTGLALATT